MEFDGGSISYYYLTDDTALAVGDIVIVPVGDGRDTSKVEIVSIEHFSEEDAPFPLAKMKNVLRKCTDEDFEPPLSVDNTPAEKFKCITQYIEQIAEIESFGEWVFDNENYGTPERPIHVPFFIYNKLIYAFQNGFYEFEKTHIEYHLNRYIELLKNK